MPLLEITHYSFHNVRSWHEADQVTELKVRCER